MRVAEITAVGAVVVAAAGNSAGHAVSAPANCPGVIAVAGLRHAGTKVGFSDLGPDISISAPAGNCVDVGRAIPASTRFSPRPMRGSPPRPHAAGGSIYTDSFNASLGTSFSAPLVAGTAALMLSAQPTLTPAAVRTALQATARPFPTSGGEQRGRHTGAAMHGAAAGGVPQIDQVECYCTTTTCGAGMLDAGAAGSRRGEWRAGRHPNYQGLVVERAGRFGVGVGDQHHAPGQHHLRHLVHLRLDGKPLWLVVSAD